MRPSHSSSAIIMGDHIDDPADSWIPNCVPVEGSSLSEEGQSTTYAQLKAVCQMTVLKSTESDILSSLGDPKETTPKALRPHSTPATLLWLEENYETAEGVCIPRSALYMHYVDFCQRNGMQPVNAASFGKIIRQQFPHLTTRRLGTRGQSRYHYYGIAVKETSPYYDISYSKRGCGSVNDLKKDAIKQVFNYGQTMSYSPRNKLGSLLPDFAHLKDIKLPATVPEEKVSTFLMMYRTHCQRILDTVIRASFDEVQSFLQHFWNGMPSHILSIIGSNVIVNIVGVCDSFVYKSICNVLFPTVLQALPDSLIQVIRKFAKELTTWLRTALADLPENIKAIKFDLAKRFSQTLRRQTSLNHLSQASRMVLHNADITGQMLQDWRHVDLDSICRQTLYKVDDQSSNGISLDFVTSLYKEFEGLLEEQAPIEAFMEWLESLVNRCVVQPGMKRRWSLRRLARHFLLMWSSFGTCVIRDMTLHSAPSFGSFHLLHLTFDEYVLYLVESLYLDELTQELLANIPNDAPPNVVDNVFDDSISDSELGMCKIRWCQSQTHGTMTGYLESDHTMGSTTAEILVHTSPVQNIINSNSLITDEAEPGDPQERDCQIMREYSMPVNEHHHSMYHYTTNDARSSCPYGTGINASSRQETKLYTCHPTSQSYPISPQLEGSNGSSNGQVSSYRAADTTANAVDYSNYAPFASGRRINFAADCRTYYDTSMSTASPMYPIASNTYYQSYEASSSSPICCPSHYNSSPDPPINSVDNNEPNSVAQHNVSNGSNGNGHSDTSGKSQGNDAELDEDKVQDSIVFAAASVVNNRQ